MRTVFTTMLIAACSVTSIAHAHKQCAENAMKRGHQKTTVATPEENDYDIKGLKFDLNMTNTSTVISGNVTTYARTAIANFSVYAFELDPVLTIDSVKINNQIVPVVTTGLIRRATLSTAIGINTDFTAQVFYHGTAKAGSGQFFTGGLNHVTVSANSQIVYSISDDLFAKDWWPCKQSLMDKVDSVTMWVTVDDTLNVAGNGLLKNKTQLAGNKLRYEWETKYAIDYYLIAVAVGPYKDYSYYMHYTDGSGDSMLVQNYVYDSSSYMTPGIKATFDTTGAVIDHFSKLFGKYPFKDEKYGHCMTSLSGGMEHQTMSWMGSFVLSPALVAHELAHQWWGNSVTYGRWDHVWLSEGFASYAEQLFLEEFDSKQAAQTERTSEFNYVMSQNTGSVWVNDTTSVSRIFNGRLTYSKGASVVHMLRYLAPEDSLFFNGLRAYQQQHKYGHALTEDLQTIMEQAYNMPLDSFFRQWVYGEGYPTYAVKWAQSGALVHVKIDQTTSHNSVKLYNIPLEIKLSSFSGDTIVKVNVENLSKHHLFVWDKEVTAITIDPNDEIVNKTGLIQKDLTLLSVSDDMFSNVKVYPNPTTDGWNIANLLSGTSMKLYDINGRLVWTANATTNTYISANSLSKGVYLLELMTDGAKSAYIKLVK